MKNTTERKIVAKSIAEVMRAKAMADEDGIPTVIDISDMDFGPPKPKKSKKPLPPASKSHKRRATNAEQEASPLSVNRILQGTGYVERIRSEFVRLFLA